MISTPIPAPTTSAPQPILHVSWTEILGPAAMLAQEPGVQDPTGSPPRLRDQDVGPADPGASGTEQPLGEPGAAPGNCMQDGMLLWIVPIFAIMYFLMIRPAQKQEKQRKAMLSAVKKGDKVVTSGGLHGTIAAIDESTVTLNVGGGQQLKFDRSAVGRVLSDEQPAPTKT